MGRVSGKEWALASRSKRRRQKMMMIMALTMTTLVCFGFVISDLSYPGWKDIEVPRNVWPFFSSTSWRKKGKGHGFKWYLRLKSPLWLRKQLVSPDFRRVMADISDPTLSMVSHFLDKSRSQTVQPRTTSSEWNSRMEEEERGFHSRLKATTSRTFRTWQRGGIELALKKARCKVSWIKEICRKIRERRTCETVRISKLGSKSENFSLLTSTFYRQSLLNSMRVINPQILTCTPITKLPEAICHLERWRRSTVSFWTRENHNRTCGSRERRTHNFRLGLSKWGRKKVVRNSVTISFS